MIVKKRETLMYSRQHAVAIKQTDEKKTTTTTTYLCERKQAITFAAHFVIKNTYMNDTFPEQSSEYVSTLTSPRNKTNPNTEHQQNMISTLVILAERMARTQLDSTRLGRLKCKQISLVCLSSSLYMTLIENKRKKRVELMASYTPQHVSHTKIT